jgi:hypothetical protein
MVLQIDSRSYVGIRLILQAEACDLNTSRRLPSAAVTGHSVSLLADAATEGLNSYSMQSSHAAPKAAAKPLPWGTLGERTPAV